jgi:hypothetical protein
MLAVREMQDLYKKTRHTEFKLTALDDVKGIQGTVILRSAYQKSTVERHRMSIVRHPEVSHDFGK